MITGKSQMTGITVNTLSIQNNVMAKTILGENMKIAHQAMIQEFLENEVVRIVKKGHEYDYKMSNYGEKEAP